VTNERADEEQAVAAQRQQRRSALVAAAGITEGDLSPLGRAALDELAGCGGRWYDGYVELLTVVRHCGRRDSPERPERLAYPNPGSTTTKRQPPVW
jgi:hypothetical protein